jgi:carbohydrate-selective porin OprB
MTLRTCAIMAIACCAGIARGQSTQPAEKQGANEKAAGQSPASQAAVPAFFRIDYSGDFWTSPAMTGDWGGERTRLANNGIAFNVETLQYMQGNAHGGVDQNDAFRFCMSISDQLPPIMNAQKEQGVGLFYNVEITPWLHITPDLQVLIDPTGSDRYGTALVYGLRMQVSL